MGKTAARTAERIGGTNDYRQSYFFGYAAAFFHCIHGLAARHRFPDFNQQLFEKFSVFGVADGLNRCAEHADVEFIQNPGIGQFHGQVQPCLSAERRQQSVGTFFFNNA